MKLSVVVPTLNEAAGISEFLSELRRRVAAEIIVADGGSDDTTREIASDIADNVVIAPRSRAKQMNAGAGAATGDVLWFLHADCIPPERSDAAIEYVLRDGRVVGGFFSIRFPRRDFVYRITDSVAHYLGLLFRFRCGDHGFVVRREVFDAIGGFPDVPVMEDVVFFRELHRRGRVAVIPQRLIVSPRRYEQVGPWRLTFAFGLIAALYLLGVKLTALARLYSRLCTRSFASRSAR